MVGAERRDRHYARLSPEGKRTQTSTDGSFSVTPSSSLAVCRAKKRSTVKCSVWCSVDPLMRHSRLFLQRQPGGFGQPIKVSAGCRMVDGLHDMSR